MREQVTVASFWSVVANEKKLDSISENQSCSAKSPKTLGITTNSNYYDRLALFI
jgi:hypothetical protein